MNPRRGQVEKFLSFSSFRLILIYVYINVRARVYIYIFYLDARGSREKGKEFYNWTPRATLFFFFLFYLQSIRSFRDPPFEKVKRKVSTDSKIGVSYLRRPYKVVDRFNFVFFGNHKASLLA